MQAGVAYGLWLKLKKARGQWPYLILYYDCWCVLGPLRAMVCFLLSAHVSRQSQKAENENRPFFYLHPAVIRVRPKPDHKNYSGMTLTFSLHSLFDSILLLFLAHEAREAMTFVLQNAKRKMGLLVYRADIVKN